MNAARVTLELVAIQRRTRRMVIASTIFHAVLLFYFVWQQIIAPPEEQLTEITWLESEEVEAMIAAALALAAAKAETPEPVAQHFEREKTKGDVAPEPQNIDAFEDRIGKRLASLQKATTAPMAALDTPISARRSSLAGLSEAEPASRPDKLTRAPKPSARPIELKRNTMRIQRAAIALPLIEETPPAAMPARQTEAVSQRVVAGVSMTGPVADRPLVSYSKPSYPEWAKREAIEGSVNIYFVVQPDGTVKENVMIQKTSGFEDFDHNASEALLAWRFAPLKRGDTGEQWGSITFHYRLNEGN